MARRAACCRIARIFKRASLFENEAMENERKHSSEEIERAVRMVGHTRRGAAGAWCRACGSNRLGISLAGDAPLRRSPCVGQGLVLAAFALDRHAPARAGRPLFALRAPFRFYLCPCAIEADASAHLIPLAPEPVSGQGKANGSVLKNRLPLPGYCLRNR